MEIWCIKTFCFSNSALLSFILVDANLTVYILVQHELKFFATSLLFLVGSEINSHCSNITSICERDILFIALTAEIHTKGWFFTVQGNLTMKAIK